MLATESDDGISSGGGSGLYNLPFTPTDSRSDVYGEIISEFAQGGRIEILEIGVFKGSLIKGIMRHSKEMVKSYTGVDPYIGDETDPYHRSYWKSDQAVAFSQYEETKSIYDGFGAELVRQRSEDFFAANERTFDVVIIDGDHRYEPARKDLHAGLQALRPGGLLICDDYGNSDTPEVTRAVCKFVEEAGDFYDAAGYRPIWFMNVNKPAPIQLTAIYWRKRTLERSE
ncbi:SAM-dependent methyltransferase [Sphingobium xanthum]|jgi:SAM-dependent methyltransferase|uniref:class I SAM-dependent methyltransferase n=1 Tax=Sphingobium xanthum TaxID=1387165 RepID=UPI001C8BD438|nr:class I SAM-dependent methyltransferase [Sphingobium xanthum]